MPIYQVVPRPKENLFRIFAQKKDHEKILDLLLEKSDCFVKGYNFIASRSYLEIDHRALNILLREGQEIGVEKDVKSAINSLAIEEAAFEEKALAQKLAEENYDLDLRIWTKTNANGNQNYFCKIDSDIYSSESLKDLFSLIKGEYLVESYKPMMRISPNPLEVFGAFNVTKDLFSPNKSTIRFNSKNFSRKKRFEPLIQKPENFRIIIDGADDTANAMTNTGVPQKFVDLVQGTVIFPAFLQGVYWGFSGLSEESLEQRLGYQESNFNQAKFEIRLKKFRQEICQKCSLDFQELENTDSEELLKRIASALQENDDLEKAEIITLTNNYLKEIGNPVEATNLTDVLSAYTGFAAMSAMTTAVAAYEIQAVMNIAGGVKGATNAAPSIKAKVNDFLGIKGSILSKDSSLSMLSQVGNLFGFGGQVLMAAFAFSQMIEERKEWKEVEQDLKQFSNATNVSDFAKEISEAMLRGKRNNHKTKTFGNAALSMGQSAMAVGGPIVIGCSPLLFCGLGLTLGGISINSISDLKYTMSYGINEDLDEIETAILKQNTTFTDEDFSDISAAIKKQAQRQIFALEILGHLRAPQWLLYQKYLQDNQDATGIITKAAQYLGVEAIHKWLNQPPLQSVDLIRDHPLITINPQNPYDLDIFSVDTNWLEVIWQKADELLINHESTNLDRDQKHREIIKEFQDQFIEIKSRSHNSKPCQSAKEVCERIIERGGEGAQYLQKKLMRAIANQDLRSDEKLDAGLSEIRKNGKKIIIGKLDLSNIPEKDLEDFLTKKRTQKTLGKLEKKSPLSKAYEKDSFEEKSNHLRVFSVIPQISKMATKLSSRFQLPETETPDEREFDEEILAPSKAIRLKPIRNIPELPPLSRKGKVIIYSNMNETQIENNPIDERLSIPRTSINTNFGSLQVTSLNNSGKGEPYMSI